MRYIKIESGKKKLLKIIVIILFSVIIFAISFYIIERKVIYPVKYEGEVLKYSKEYDLDKYLVYSVIKEESGFNKNAVSNKNAYGLMQLTENTANEISNKIGIDDYDLFNSETNIHFGCYYIRYLINKFENIDTAIIAYNAGEGNVLKWLKDERYSSDNKTLKQIPYKESENYLKRIKETFEKYKKLYGLFLDK